MRPGQPSTVTGPGGDPAGAFAWEPPPYRPRWWLHVALFLATLWSATFVGATWIVGLPYEPPLAGGALSTLWLTYTDPRLVLLALTPSYLVHGLAFSLPLISILLAHEMGHYLAARRHGLAATPPFFIPLPIPLFPIGTLGAVIRIKDPIRSKRQLLDVGATGPVAGFLAMLPFLAWGLAVSEVGEAPSEASYFEFAEPLVYRLVAAVVRPGLSSDDTLWLHPIGMAAWFGILITLLNMLPFSQLDGGHVTYSLLGRWHRRLAWPLLGVLVALGFLWPGWWVWVVIALVLNPRHPTVWDESHPLDPGRKLLGWAAVAVFVLCFMLAPVRIIGL